MASKIKKGYTLVELLMVTSLIGVMASITVPSFRAMQDEAKTIKAEAEVKTLQTIVERYQKQNGRLPENLDLEKFTTAENIAQQPIHDPFMEQEKPYSLITGRSGNNKEYYVVYSSGRNGEPEFSIQNNSIVLKGDDIVASNLPIIH